MAGFYHNFYFLVPRKEDLGPMNSRPSVRPSVRPFGTLFSQNPRPKFSVFLHEVK